MEKHTKDGHLPTAQEHINDRGFATWFVAHSDTEGEVVINFSDCKEAMIEFAKLHVQAALEAAKDSAKLLVINSEEYTDHKDLLDEYECGSDTVVISASSIINSYPLTNIK
ncbi:MAG: hypothetical protein WCP46_00370 [Alphaproteobacteria bacterium]